MNIAAVHERLLRAHGLQGWWPLLELAGTPESASADASAQYHPGDYSYPRTKRQQFEIGAGAVLTQNTAWRNAEAALGALAGAGLLCPARIVRQPAVELAAVIRACGSFNVKAKKLQTFSRFYQELCGRTPTRTELLQVWGIGPETADSILLYAYAEPSMVVDAYTQRILTQVAAVPERSSYAAVQAACMAALPAEVPAYQEFHALMVAHGKRYYSRRPWRDPVLT